MSVNKLSNEQWARITKRAQAYDRTSGDLTVDHTKGVPIIVEVDYLKSEVSNNIDLTDTDTLGHLKET